MNLGGRGQTVRKRRLILEFLLTFKIKIIRDCETPND